jgi:hypothetical protein
LALLDVGCSSFLSGLLLDQMRITRMGGAVSAAMKRTDNAINLDTEAAMQTSAWPNQGAQNNKMSLAVGSAL